MVSSGDRSTVGIELKRMSKAQGFAVPIGSILTKPTFLLFLVCPGFFLPNLIAEQSDSLFVRYLASWDGSEDNQTGFRNPEGLSVSPAGYLYVADTGNHRIVKLHSDGRQIATIGGFGWEAEQFDRPVSLDASNGLDVLVVDFQNHRIQRYDKDLHFLASFFSSADWPESQQFGYPRDVALSPQGELFCLDGENNRILKLDITGTPQMSFGDFDAGQGRLIDPKRFLIDRRGNILVSDDSRICVFDGLGNFLMILGEGILEDPRDLCATDELILVADAGRKSVVGFRFPNGFCGEFKIPAITGQSFQEPVAVVCQKNKIYVLDSKRNRLDVFQWVKNRGDK